MFEVRFPLASSLRRSFIGLLLGASLCALMAGRAQAVTVQQWNTPGGQWVNPKDEASRDLVNGHLVTNVVLPTNYSSRKCWPVIYLLHGTADSTSTQVSLQWLQLDNGALLKMNIPAILVIPGQRRQLVDQRLVERIPTPCMVKLGVAGHRPDGCEAAARLPKPQRPRDGGPFDGWLRGHLPS